MDFFTFVKLHSKLGNPTELQLDGVGVDFVFPPSRVTTTANPHQNLPEGSVLQTRNLALILSSQCYSKVTTSMDGHLSSLGWSTTNARMANHQQEVHYRLGIWHLD